MHILQGTYRGICTKDAGSLRQIRVLYTDWASETTLAISFGYLMITFSCVKLTILPKICVGFRHSCYLGYLTCPGGGALHGKIRGGEPGSKTRSCNARPVPSHFPVKPPPPGQGRYPG